MLLLNYFACFIENKLNIKKFIKFLNVPKGDFVPKYL